MSETKADQLMMEECPDSMMVALLDVALDKGWVLTIAKMYDDGTLVGYEVRAETPCGKYVADAANTTLAEALDELIGEGSRE